MEKKPEITIVVPAYNEEDGIAMVIDGLQFNDKNYEIIVVDDGSMDNTANIVRQYSNVKLIKHKTNMGYGAALKTGVKHSNSDLIAIIDADGTYPNERIPEFVKITRDNDYDMVIGSRSGEHVKIPTIRKPAKWFINKLANYLAGEKIPDLNSGFRIIKKELIEKFSHILPDGFSFTTTITLAMLTNKYEVKYIPINYFKREGKSKIRPIKDTLNFIQLVIRTILYFDPLKIFVPFSALLVLLAFIVLAGSWYFLGRAMDITFGVISMTAVIVLAIGMLADLIDKRMQ